MNLKKLFRPKSLALVGGYWADFVIQGNRKLGFNGPIWHINPKRKNTKKNKYYKSIEELPDVEIIIVPIGGGSGACGACIVAKSINPEIKVKWILEENLPVRMQLQLHKQIWNPQEKSV